MKFIRFPKFKFVCLRNKVDKRITNVDIYYWIINIIQSCQTKEQLQTANKLFKLYLTQYKNDLKMQWILDTHLVLKRNELYN